MHRSPHAQVAVRVTASCFVARCRPVPWCYVNITTCPDSRPCADAWGSWGPCAAEGEAALSTPSPIAALPAALRVPSGSDRPPKAAETALGACWTPCPWDNVCLPLQAPDVWRVRPEGDVRTTPTVTHFDCALGSNSQETLPQLQDRRPLGCMCLQDWSYGSYGSFTACANPADEWPVPWWVSHPFWVDRSLPIHTLCPVAFIEESYRHEPTKAADVAGAA